MTLWDTASAACVGIALVSASMRQLRNSAVVFKSWPEAVTTTQQLRWRESNDNPCLCKFLAMAHALDLATFPAVRWECR